MSVMWLAVARAALAYVVQAWLRKNKNRRLPPSPIGLPILGHLHMLGKLPHRDLHQLAKRHGPIMHLSFGFVPHIIISLPEAAKLILKTHDLVFASRPPNEAAKVMSYEQRNFSFAEYGPYWRTVRKLCILELLSNLKINSFKSMRREELGLLIKSVEQAARDGVAVDLSAMVASTNADMTCRMVFGKKYSEKDFDERGFKDIIQEGMHLGATPNIGDYFPYVGALDLQGLERRMKLVSKVFDGFLEKIIDEHVQARDKKHNRDFVDIVLAFMMKKEKILRYLHHNDTYECVVS